MALVPFTRDIETWVDPAGRTLSDRIWSQRARLEGRIDRIIQDGIRLGETPEEVAETLLTYVRPSYARYGNGKARHAALRLAGHEMRRAHSLATRDVALNDPASGKLRYRVSAGHVGPDECTEIARRATRHGQGVYLAADCPLPPRHIGCVCATEAVYGDVPIDDFVDGLRVEFGLDQEPDDLSPADLAIYRRETARVREQVTFLFDGWFEQTGLVSREQLLDTSPTVRDWVDSVQAEKRRRRG